MKNLNELYARAVEIARNAHTGQFDKGGNPYIEHSLAVADGVNTTEQKIVAVLHDVLEDSSVTAEDLLREGFPAELVESVRILTHNHTDDGSYEDYICCVRQNPVARAVKISDLCHNLDLSRIPHPTQHDRDRCKKYKKALAKLREPDL